jgi:hypothetical protein
MSMESERDAESELSSSISSMLSISMASRVGSVGAMVGLIMASGDEELAARDPDGWDERWLTSEGDGAEGVLQLRATWPGLLQL